MGGGRVVSVLVTVLVAVVAVVVERRSTGSDRIRGVWSEGSDENGTVDRYWIRGVWSEDAR